MMDCNRADIGVGPRSSDDLDDADVAAIPSGLGAQLQDEVGSEVEDEAAPPADGKKWPKEDLGGTPDSLRVRVRSSDPNGT